ncbi:hypothetical protein P280DRAFT_198695 [Massarina eburnea CBS 473.64]|uniref:Ecp2 effector protein domain-containing protein n=1 Tax=Massarina eburnea CBS 473.64 TaxID=1395130 RepID=A0A6A6RIZ9_9PLEO|nr:hypothetical protein P280DRAFT_198695 [Massarina eburnea CBS 473.64]
MLSKLAAAFSLISAITATSITPHDVYGSSIGVLGCHVNTNRIAYWPSTPGCNNLCKKVTSNGRVVYLLHIDQSGGAYDISYDAWNYLNVGKSAKESPTQGGGINAQIEEAPMDKCADLILTHDKKLPLSAANSMGAWAGCAKGTWLHENSSLWNIQNPTACTLGFNEVCSINLKVSNQATCAHVLGVQDHLSGVPVKNIVYGTGKEVIALQ